MKLRNLLALGALAGVLAGSAQADTYALLVGINDYPEPVGADGKPLKDKDGNVMTNDLRGAVNDVNEMKNILVTLYGVPEANVKVVTDGAANEQGFVDGMKWLIQSAKPGDQVIFHYSGHGGQIKVEKSAEDPDGLDEVIVLADDKLVPDDLFGKIAKSLASKGVHATLLFDSCHSGGMSRDAGDRVFRTKSLDLAKSKRAKSVQAAALNGLQAQARGIVTGTGQEKGSYAFLFASKEDQTSSDVSFKNNVKPAHGIFTLVMSMALKDKPEFGLDALEALVVDVLKELKYSQIPNFEYSSADRASKPLVWK